MSDATKLRDELKRFAYASSTHVGRELMDAATDHAVREAISWRGDMPWKQRVEAASMARDCFIEGALFQTTRKVN